MTPESVLSLFSESVYIIIILLTVLIIPGLIVGLLVSMFQAATQINEMSLSFIPQTFCDFFSDGICRSLVIKNHDQLYRLSVF
jgi:flagellar biosynthetic protein FliQ